MDASDEAVFKAENVADRSWEAGMGGGVAHMESWMLNIKQGRSLRM